MNLNHIHIGTKDIKTSVAFYTVVLGFRMKFEHDPGVFLDNESGFLIAIDPVDEVPQFPDWFPFGFCVKSETEVFDIYRIVKAKKIRIARDMMSEKDRFASFYMHDPDGYKIEVSWHNE